MYKSTFTGGQGDVGPMTAVGGYEVMYVGWHRKVNQKRCRSMKMMHFVCRYRPMYYVSQCCPWPFALPCFTILKEVRRGSCRGCQDILVSRSESNLKKRY